MKFKLVFPFVWLKRITHKNGKPNYIAIILLSYLISDEVAPQKYIEGELNPYYKEGAIYFKRETFANMFKCTKRNVSLTLKFLEDMNLIKRIVDRESNVIKQEKLKQLKKNLKNNKINSAIYEKEKNKINSKQNSVYSKLFILVNKEEIAKLNN